MHMNFGITDNGICLILLRLTNSVKAVHVLEPFT